MPTPQYEIYRKILNFTPKSPYVTTLFLHCGHEVDAAYNYEEFVKHANRVQMDAFKWKCPYCTQRAVLDAGVMGRFGTV